MTDTPETDPKKEMLDWWRTSIIDMEPGVIRYRGYAIEEMIGNVSFTEMIWLMTRGELPDRTRAKLLDAALMSAVDHGPQAPSIAIARMAATCGIGLNNAIASGVNALGDVHGGPANRLSSYTKRLLDVSKKALPWWRPRRRKLTTSPPTEVNTYPASVTVFTPSIRARRGYWNWSILLPRKVSSAAVLPT